MLLTMFDATEYVECMGDDSIIFTKKPVYMRLTEQQLHNIWNDWTKVDREVLKKFGEIYDIEGIKILMEYNHDTNCNVWCICSSVVNLAMIKAARRGSLRGLKYLARHIVKRMEFACTAELGWYAAYNKDLPMMKWIYENGCYIDAHDLNGHNATYICILNKNYEMLKWLISKPLMYDSGAFSFAIYKSKDPEMVKFLLQQPQTTLKIAKHGLRNAKPKSQIYEMISKFIENHVKNSN